MAFLDYKCQTNGPQIYYRHAYMSARRNRKSNFHVCFTVRKPLFVKKFPLNNFVQQLILIGRTICPN